MQGFLTVDDLTYLLVSSQDAIDLISGRYTVNRNGHSPFRPKGFESLSVSALSL